MSTRMYWNGREVYASDRPPREDNLVRPRKRDRLLDNAAEPEPPANLPPRCGELYDEHEKLNYRVVQKLNLADGWCLATQLMQHYDVPYGVILDWARRGFVDPVMELHSPTRRFRVRDDVLCRNLAAEHKAEQALKQVRRDGVQKAKIALREQKKQRNRA